jgi:hypothetical protein
MLKMRTLIAFSLLFFLYGCQNESVKGKWTPDDKQKAKQEMIAGFKKNGSDKIIGNKVIEEFCDCVIENLEDHYDNPKEADKDQMGINQYAKKCIFIFDPKRR